MYTELHARSAFSFLEGACLPEELAAVAAEYGMGAIAITDRDGVYGAPRFYAEAQKRKLKAHIGAEISLQTDSPQRHRGTEGRISKRQHQPRNQNFSVSSEKSSLPVIVHSREGY